MLVDKSDWLARISTLLELGDLESRSSQKILDIYFTLYESTYELIGISFESSFGVFSKKWGERGGEHVITVDSI